MMASCSGSSEGGVGGVGGVGGCGRMARCGGRGTGCLEHVLGGHKQFGRVVGGLAMSGLGGVHATWMRPRDAC